MRTTARRLVRRHPLLRRRFELLCSLKGIGTVSALYILGELCLLPPDMGPRQWVAHAGPDPPVCDSGTSVRAGPSTGRSSTTHNPMLLDFEESIYDLNAAAGWTAIARRAGSSVATKPVARITATMAAKMERSQGWTR